MKWLTIEQIKAAAEKSTEEALKCSLEHWRQLCNASKKELLMAYEEGLTGAEGEYCALCHRFVHMCGKHACIHCPLKGKIRDICCSEWRKASAAFEDLWEGYGTHKKFVKAARRMRDRIKRELKKLKEKEK